MNRCVRARLLLAAVIAIAPAAHCAEWPGSGVVEFVVPSVPASGLDTAGRTIKSLFDSARLISTASVVINKSGASGTLAYQYLNQRPGNGRYLAIATALGGANHIAAAAMLKDAGIDVKAALYVGYKSGADALIALLSGDVDVVPVAAPVSLPQLAGGKVRVIAVSSPERLGGALAGVPTWNEQGIATAGRPY